MTRLSVNVNKIATLRNARGGNTPNVLQVALDCERFGAEGITVHPRPDERHIRYNDVRDIKPTLSTELNVEGYPNASFMKLVKEVHPAQVTLVPDGPDVLTSNAGWDVVTNRQLLQDIVGQLKEQGMRVSVFMNPDTDMIAHVPSIGADNIELYTEAYASGYAQDREAAIAAYATAAKAATAIGLKINAGHDLNLENLRYFVTTIPGIEEVSIGHALVADALYFGLENTIQMYQRELREVH